MHTLKADRFIGCTVTEAMSSLWDRVRHDEQEYLELCRKYKEEPEMFTTSEGNHGCNPYGQHAYALWAREKEHNRV